MLRSWLYSLGQVFSRRVLPYRTLKVEEVSKPMLALDTSVELKRRMDVLCGDL